MCWRVKDLIDFHIDDAVIDVFEVSEEQATGRNRMMYAVVARSAAVKQRIDALNDAGLNLSVIDIPELAMRNIAALLPEDMGGVGLIYLLGGGGLITISRQGKLYLSRHVDTLQDAEAASQASDAIEAPTQSWLDRIVIELPTLDGLLRESLLSAAHRSSGDSADAAGGCGNRGISSR